MRAPRTLITLGIGLLLCAVVAVIAVTYPALASADEGLSKTIIGFREITGTTELAFFANYVGGGVLGTWVIPAVTAIIIVLLRRPWGAAYFLAASIASAVLVQLLKSLVARPRPADILVQADFGSFPSGHTANAATITVALSLIFGWRILVGIGSVWVVFMAFSRILLGAHWPTDTIAGAMLGVAVALLVWPLFESRVLLRDAASIAPPRPARA